MTTSTSALFGTWDYLEQLLKGLSLGSSPMTGVTMPVYFGFPDDGGLPDEVVVLHAAIESDAEQTWATFGPGKKEERFGCLITVRCAAPGQTLQMARDRLQEVTSAIEAELRSIRRPVVDDVLWWSVAGFAPVIETIPNHGAVGRARVVITCLAYF